MDARIVEATLKAHIAEMRQRLDQATGIAKAAEACAEAGNIEKAIEVALDGVQSSTRYPGGVALRFARVKRYRPDKSPGEADTIDDLRALLG